MNDLNNAPIPKKQQQVCFQRPMKIEVFESFVAATSGSDKVESKLRFMTTDWP